MMPVAKMKVLMTVVIVIIALLLIIMINNHQVIPQSHIKSWHSLQKQYLLQTELLLSLIKTLNHPKPYPKAPALGCPWLPLLHQGSGRDSTTQSTQIPGIFTCLGCNAPAKRSTCTRTRPPELCAARAMARDSRNKASFSMVMFLNLRCCLQRY